MKRTGAQSLVLALEAAGVTDVFGIPGGAILPAYDPLLESKIRHILVRHEQGAGHAAEGYAAATGRVGVCIATSGPGATNLVTPLADAFMDSVPILAITGQVNSNQIGTDAFQEVDTRGMTMPITKHNMLVEDASRIPSAIAEAFHIASTGRPGPVLVDITKTALLEASSFRWPTHLDLPGYRLGSRVEDGDIERAASMLLEADRPVLYVGGGVVRADASASLLALVELTGAPVVTTLMARGTLPSSHPRNLGMPGMHGTVHAVAALQKSDLIVALGARFDNRVTGALSTFAPSAKVVHVDIDPAEIGKNRVVDVAISADCREAIDALNRAIERLMEDGAGPHYERWNSYLENLRRRYPMSYEDRGDGALPPQLVLERLGTIVGSEAVYVAGVGQHQMWASHYLDHRNPRNWITSGGLGTMGFSVPAAMGAKVGRPEATVWSVDGDGCFQMTGRELATCALNNIPIKVAIINNSSLGMVRQLQSLYYSNRINSVDLGTRNRGQRVPDFPALAEAYGCVGLSCDSPSDVDRTIEKAMSIDDAPVVVDFRVRPEEMVWPAIGDGMSNDEITYARGVAPDFEADDL